MKVNFILFVSDQASSTLFYSEILNKKPQLEVPGMTEFELGEGIVLGLIPENGVKKILGDTISNPEKNNGESRCELYLSVEDPEVFIERSIKAGAILLSPFQKRNWGDSAGYVKDRDGHVIAFAKNT